jgi:Met-10+ like-protein
VTNPKATPSSFLSGGLKGLSLRALDSILNAAAGVVRALPPVRGRGVIAQYVCGFPIAREGEWSIPMEQGHVLNVPRSSFQTWMAAFTGRYEEEELKLIRRFIAPGSLVLDIGACFGFYTIPLGVEAQRRGAYVVAFEPVPANFVVLKNNVETNRLTDTVRALPIGLGATDQTAPMLVERGGAGNAIVFSE